MYRPMYKAVAEVSILSSIDPIARLAERQVWIRPEAMNAAQSTIRETFQSLGPAGEKLKNALHGTWLHQPLHAVLTDLPLGAWSAAVAFDTAACVTGSRKMNNAADAAIAFGLIGAVGAAITGLNDWSEVREEAPRRIGVVHAILNVGATGLFLASCLARRKGDSRSRARGLALLGYAVVSASAHLGGNLVYEHKVGVQGSAKENDYETGSAKRGEQQARDPEDRPVPHDDERAQRERSLDKTLADSFPTSDPPSSIPDPV